MAIFIYSLTIIIIWHIGIIGLYGINSGSTTPGNAVNHDSVFMDSQKIQITIEKGCAKKLMPEPGVGGFAHAGVPGKKPCLFSVKYGC